MPLLEVRELIKAFGRLLALGGVDLTVRENEFHGLIGPHGSGKSTLMRCVAGAERATEGNMNRDRRSIDQVLEWFPKLAQRLGQPAGKAGTADGLWHFEVRLIEKGFVRVQLMCPILPPRRTGWRGADGGGHGAVPFGPARCRVERTYPSRVSWSSGLLR
jgi:energy-coupling factor transporter ATP-binding protein EcfA2